MARGSHKPIGRSYQAVMQTDRNLFVHLIGLLQKKQLLPVVIFTFSKKRCEEYAGSLSKTDLCTSLEKSEIHVFIERSLVRLRGSDKELPQILRMRELLSRGIAVHHGGLLPIIKEVSKESICYTTVLSKYDCYRLWRFSLPEVWSKYSLPQKHLLW